MLKYYHATHVGLVRKHNEDSLTIIEPNTFVVADGMGGQAAGEIASQMLVATVTDVINSSHEPFDENILKSAILTANEKIIAESKQNKEREGMGTTATILHVSNHTAYYAHVGDSRLYKLESNILNQITQDHSYVQSLVRSGQITQEQANVHPMKNILTQAVGGMHDLSVDCGNFPVHSGDVFLLCTDGLSNMLSDQEITLILQSSHNPAGDLIEAALNHGGKDNISVIIVGLL